MADKLLSGIVTKSSELIISVAFEEIPENIDITAHNGALQLVKLANDVTYRRLKRYTCVYVHVFLSLHVCMYVCLYVCVYVCVGI